MSASFDYDRRYDPPAPVVAVRVSDLAGDEGVLVHGLVDTGADVTLIPPDLARGLGLPAVGTIRVSGVGGGGGAATVYAGRVEMGGARSLVRLVAYEDEVILGRDVLNRWVLVLDGPAQRLGLSFPPSGAPPRK